MIDTQDYSATEWGNEKPEGVLSAHIQWKGTSAYGELRCAGCDAYVEFDGHFAYFITCPLCGTCHQLKWHVEMRVVDPSLSYCEAERIEAEPA